MPASMISADTGGSAYVAGSNIAMVATGPMPGSTPISVPSTQPMKQYSRLMGVTATPKPVARFVNSSMFLFPSARDELGPHRELQFQQHDEGEVAADAQDDRKDRDFLPLEFVAGQSRNERQADDGD